MNNDITEKSQSSAPVWGVDKWWKVALWKFGFLVFVEILSKAGAVALGWPFFCGAIVGAVHYFEIKVDVPIWLMLSIQAILLGMFAFKSTTKKLLADAGEAAKAWAKK